MVSSVGPPIDMLVGIGVVVLSLLVAVALVTLGRSIAGARRDARRDVRRPDLQTAIVERMGAADPEWQAWVAGLDRTERSVAKEILRAYFDLVDGEARESLRGLGRALGIDRTARWNLRTGNRFERLEALSWIALLDVDISIETLRSTCLETPETRAGAARVLYEQDRADAARVGTAFLLEDPDPLSVFGVDTLYQLNKSDPSPLLDRAKEAYGIWSESLLIQVLQVIGKTSPTTADNPLGWIGFLFVSDSLRVRRAAAEAIVGYGWHSDIRAVVDVDQIRTDESSRVRRAVYRTLAAWDDAPSSDALVDAVRTESDPRSAVVAVEALDRTGIDPSEIDRSSASEAALAWVQAKAVATDAEVTG
ncbi:MAG: hypothetical protein ACI8VE_000680 [Natrialbaceae archaeon]|jgi:hypothetical protein